LVAGLEALDRVYESRIDELKNAEIAKWKSKTQEADSQTNQIVIDIAIQQEPRHISPAGKEFLALRETGGLGLANHHWLG